MSRNNTTKRSDYDRLTKQNVFMLTEQICFRHEIKRSCTKYTSGAETTYLSEHLSSPPVLSGVRVTPSLVLYVCFVDRCLCFVLFLLVIVLSVLLRHTDFDYPFSIFKLF